MFNRKKSMKLTNVVLATTLATSVIAVTNPAGACFSKRIGKERKASGKGCEKS